MASIDDGPDAVVIIEGHEIEVPTMFVHSWRGTTLSGSYIVNVGDVPQHGLYFPNFQEQDPIFISESEVRVKLSTKVGIARIKSKTRRLVEIRKLLGIGVKAYYTVEELQTILDESCSKAPCLIRHVNSDLATALKMNNESMINRAVKRKAPTTDEVIDIYKKATELRSNFLMNLVKSLRRS